MSEDNVVETIRKWEIICRPSGTHFAKFAMSKSREILVDVDEGYVHIEGGTVAPFDVINRLAELDRKSMRTSRLDLMMSRFRDGKIVFDDGVLLHLDRVKAWDLVDQLMYFLRHSSDQNVFEMWLHGKLEAYDENEDG